jgi:hypothetical protein
MLASQPNFRFSGHETFVCRYAWLPKAVHAVKADRTILGSAKLDEAMVELGVGKNMVRSVRFWAEAADIVQATKTGHEPTTFGTELLLGTQKVPALDPYLEDIQTLWLLHWKLATNQKSLVFGWDFLINHFQEPELYASAVTRAFQKAVTNSADKDVTPGSLEQLYEVFLHSYVPTRGRKEEAREDSLDCPLVELDLLRSSGFTKSPEGRIEPKFAFRREDKPEISPALFAFCLNEFWDACFPEEDTLPFHKVVVAHGSPGQVFKIPEADIRLRLLALEATTNGALVFEESATIPRITFTAGKVPPTLAQVYAMETVHD